MPFSVIVARFQRIISCWVILLFVLLATGTDGFAQNPTMQGIPPHQVMESHEFDNINLGDLGTTIIIPVIEKQGPIPFKYALMQQTFLTAYTLFDWNRQYICQSYCADNYTNFAGYLLTGAPLNIPFNPDAFSGSPGTGSPGQVTYYCTGAYNQGCSEFSQFVLVDNLGSGHPFAPLTICFQGALTGCAQSGVVTTIDGSGYTMVGSCTTSNCTLTVYDVSGNMFAGNQTNPAAGFSSNATDPNGNKITTVYSIPQNYASGVFTWSGPTDTAGTSSLTAYSTYGEIYANPMTESYSYVDAAGTTVSYSVGWTNFGFPSVDVGCTNWINGSPILWNFPTTITLPDTSTIQLAYEQNALSPGKITGRIGSITLPTGGVITYTYPSTNCSDGTPATMTRTTSDGTWTYTHLPGTGCTNSGCSTPIQTTVKDPAGNNTVYTFAPATCQVWSCSNLSWGHTFVYLIEKQVYNGAITPANLLFTEIHCYDNIFSNCTTSLNTVISLPITSENIYTYRPGITNPSLQSVQYNSLGLVTGRQVYDFGGTVPTRQDAITYGNYSGGTCQPFSNYINDRVCQSNTLDGSGNTKASTRYTYDPKGNLLTESKLVSGSIYVSRTFTHDSATGVLHTETDFNNHVATYTNTSCNNVLPSTIAVGTLSRSVTWNCSGGVELSTTDYNKKPTNYTYDAMWRKSSSTYPDGGQTSQQYNLTSSPPNIVGKTLINTQTSLSIQTNLDGLGRRVRRLLTTDPEGTGYTDSAYDVDGRLFTVSNPYRSTSDPTYGVTTTLYDALDRVTTQTNPDSTVVVTTYSNSNPNNVCATVTDNTGEAREACFDGLGRMTEILEDPNGRNYETDYTYDALDNLLTVTQKGGSVSSSDWRVRNFQYDDLSRLTSASNPETGTITYSYTNSTGGLCSGDLSKVCIRTAPKPNQVGSTTVATTYTYNDVLNRLTEKSYNDGSTATVSFGYDGAALSGCTVSPPTLADSNPNGFRTSMCDASGATSWSHDVMGRVAAESRTITGATHITNSVTYAPYNLDGTIASFTYPSGRTISYSYITSGLTAGRMLSAVESAHSINYVTNATYSPHGALSGFQNGASIFGALTYNSRLQPQQTYYTTGTVPTPTQLQQTCPTTVATIMNKLYDFHLGTNDDGNVYSITDCLVSSRTQNFYYDQFKRLAAAFTTGTSTVPANWGEVYTIDPWGNLTNIGLMSGWHNSEVLNAAPASAKNQLNGFCYDSAGNMTGPTPCNNSSYTYDAENRITSTSGWTYVYDGDGRRVIKCDGTYPTCSSGTLYWTGTGSDPLTETDWSGTPTEEYVLFDGFRVARRNGTGNSVQYYFSDHLHSTNIIAGPTGAINRSSVYYPFGGEIVITGVSVANNYKFNGKERDAESGLDYFGARHYSSAIGRFMVPDWADKPTEVPYVNFGNPQSLNLYSFVENNPTNMGDPDGHQYLEVVQQLLETPAGQAAEEDVIGLLSSGGLLLGGLGASIANGEVGTAYPSYYHGEFQNSDGSSVFLRSTSNTNTNTTPSTQAQSTPAQPPQSQMPGQGGQRDRYVNPGTHDPNSPNFNPNKSTLPSDAEEVYQTSVRVEGKGPGEGTLYYGKNAKGEWYRYSGQNGEVHWSGRVSESDVRRAINKTTGKGSFSAFLSQMSDRMREVYLQDHPGQEQQ
jgi:RHS repeat-associated protein